MWARLEVNILAALPLLIRKDRFFSSELGLKYFISQRVASAFFLVCYFSLVMISSNYLRSLMLLFLLFKLGLPPFHSWLVRIIRISPYLQMWIIFIVQKFIPLQFLSYFSLNSSSLIIILILSLLLCFSIIKLIIRFRFILLISAWVNTCWVMVIVNRGGAWLIFLLVYGWLLLIALKLLVWGGINKLSSLAQTSLRLKLATAFNFFNLAGLPPFSGFFVKVFVLKSLIVITSLFTIILLLLLSLVVLCAYLLIFYNFISSSLPSKVLSVQALPKSLSFNIVLRWFSFILLCRRFL